MYPNDAPSCACAPLPLYMRHRRGPWKMQRAPKRKGSPKRKVEPILRCAHPAVQKRAAEWTRPSAEPATCHGR
jgi:hypothetical protein